MREIISIIFKLGFSRLKCAFSRNVIFPEFTGSHFKTIHAIDLKFGQNVVHCVQNDVKEMLVLKYHLYFS